MRFMLAAAFAAAIVGEACGEGKKNGAPPAQEPDRVVGVALRCDLTVRQDPFGDNSMLVRQAGSGDVCTMKAPTILAGVYIMQIANVRSIVTVRTAAGGSYTVETPGTAVAVGETWPK